MVQYILVPSWKWVLKFFILQIALEIVLKSLFGSCMPPPLWCGFCFVLVNYVPSSVEFELSCGELLECVAF